MYSKISNNSAKYFGTCKIVFKIYRNNKLNDLAREVKSDAHTKLVCILSLPMIKKQPNRVFAHVIYNDIFRDCVAIATAFWDYSREDGKSPVGIRGHSCTGTRGQCGGSKKGTGDLVDHCRSCNVRL